MVAAVIACGGRWLDVWSVTAAIWIAGAWIMLAPACILLVSFIIAFMLAPNAGRTASALRHSIRAYAREVWDTPRAILPMMWTRRPQDSTAATARIDRAARPLLLIHGVLCNRAIWASWHSALESAGFAPVHAIDLEPLLGTIETHASLVIREIEAMRAAVGGARIAVLAHSRGGLVAREALKRMGPHSISLIVTIATPHQGTICAGLFPGHAARELRPHSSWLRASAHAPACAPITSIYSAQDNLVVPAWRAILDETRAVEVEGYGHLGMVRRPKVIAYALEALRACESA